MKRCNFFLKLISLGPMKEDNAKGRGMVSYVLIFFSETVAPREPKTATPSPTTVEETTPTELPSTTEPRETTTVPAKGSKCSCTMSIGLEEKFGIIKHTVTSNQLEPSMRNEKLANFK